MRGASWVNADRYELVDSALRFEDWEFPYALVLGLGEAARYARTVGLDLAQRRAFALAAYARARQINTSASLRWYGLLDFVAKDVESAVRISPHSYNTVQEIDLLIEALDEMTRAGT